MWGTDKTKKERARKTVTATLLSVLLFFQLVSFGIFLPRPAQACGESVSVSTGSSPGAQVPTPDLLKIVTSCIKEFVGGVLTTSVFNALNRVAQKVAYDTAVWIASGGSGEESLVFQEGFGNYLKNTALDGVADIIGGLSGPWENLGFNLCSPSLPTISAKIQLGIANTYQPQPPKCSWQQLRSNYSAFSESVGSGEFLKGAADMFEFGGSDLSAAFQIGSKTAEISADKERDALLERLEGNGFKSLKDPITGAVQTPAAIVEEKTQDALKKGDKAEEAQIFGVFANTDKMIAAGVNIAGIFVNTLASKLLERVFTGLFDFPAPAPRDLFSLEGSEPRGRAGAGEVYADILTPRVIELSGFNFLSELGACPQIGPRRSWNCVMDSGFVAALSQGGELVTVREALDQRFLSENWPLISPQDAARNQDPFCFSSAYCYANLVKLRRARIIPIGWELAAASSKNSVATPVSLKDVVNGFNDCDPVTGGVTSEHPWCHLIDPNWILKIPQTQCRMRVAGATLISFEMQTRAEECVDTPSCIAEEADGSCKSGYGYCTRERNIWRFPGDSCPEAMSSCMTVTKRGGGESSFLLNTANFNGCTSANAGCAWYAGAQAPPIAGQDGNGEWVATSMRRYFDRDVASCEARDAGCAALIPNVPGLLRQNLLTNSSFENHTEGTPALPSDWTADPDSTTDYHGGTEAFHGTHAVRTTGVLRQGVTYQPGKTYTISAYARQTTAGGNSDVGITPLLSFFDIDQTALTTTCTTLGDLLWLHFTPGTSYTRAECSFTMPLTLPGGAEAVSATFQISQSTAGEEAWIDAVQLNEGSSAGSYIETVGYASTAAQYLRRAPDYLGCEANPTSPACSSYAAACFPDEVGCERYSPTSGDPAIPAVAAPEFECPSACAGYADFRQEPTNFESAKYPVFLVPSASRTCDASGAGCDEFTNVETEEREYFTFLRACIKSPSPDEATYYTWVGSETTGFQLEAHRLKKGEPLPFDWDSDPLTPDTTETSLNPPAYVAGFIDYGRCTAAIYALSPSDPNFDADCKQFYDVAGEISYRLRAKTIVATPDCHPYRATLSTSADCNDTGGSWDTARGECTYQGFPGESTSCQASAKSCRAYTGSAGRNVRVVFADGFEGDLADWEGGALSTESTSAGGKSLKATSGGALTKDVSPQSATAVRNGRTYLLTFWAKGTGSPEIKFTSEQTDKSNYFADNDPASATTTITLSTPWQFFSVGPVRVTWEPDPRDPLETDTDFERLRFENFSTDAFVDNIILREVAENLYLLKDSTVVPAVCDQTREGAPLPQAMLGCTEYRDRAGATSYYTGFDHICREAAVGCKSFIDTFATLETTATSYCANPPCTAAAPDTITVPADKEVFLVDDPAKACSAEKVGCETLAKPVSGTCVLPLDTRITPPSATCEQSVCDCRVDTNGSGSITITGATADEIVCQVAQGKSMCTYDIPAYVAPTFTSGVEQISGGVCELGPCNNAAGCDCRIDEKTVCKVRLGGVDCQFSGITYEEKVFRNDPAAYDLTLCADAQVGCEEWTRDDAGTSYFKAPAGQTCEYKENVATEQGKLSGWFRSGFAVPVPCDPGFITGGVLASIWRNADANYRGWVGTCEAAFSGCTEFRDPLDISTQYPNGRSYFALKNDQLNQGNNCNGQVSDREGCALFQDTSLPLLGVASSTFHAGATALKSKQSDFALVSPIDCAKTP
ncbi:MAG: carbohydrate binding domain-containing protein, partial [Patescibacteria group bacterium]